jgi:uncharacterized protein
VDFASFEKIFEAEVARIATADDPAHDLSHFKRVVKTAKALCESEKGRIEVVLPAAWLHDLVIIPKNDPRRKQASKLSAISAVQFLNRNGYPQEYMADIAHAISAHSFSANIEAKTLEAKIVQDADRLDGIGAIGIARCFATAGILKRPFYSSEDPFCETREANDAEFTLDHFFAKLFKTAATLQTEAGRIEGTRRAQVMKDYLANFKEEIF